MTKEEVRAEHFEALARMDEAQVRALKRLSGAFREACFGNCSAKDMLEVLFEREALARSAAPSD